MMAYKTSCVLLLFSSMVLLSNCKGNHNSDKTLSAPIIVDTGAKTEPSSVSDQDAKAAAKETGASEGSLSGIEGTYVVINEKEESEKCMMTITIEKAHKGYNYRFKTDSRSLNGKLTVEADKIEHGYNITLEGIEWSEYEGELDEEGEPKQELELPVGISGVIQENQIIIQNYGNSMNYYVKLPDCGKKYIVLQKQ
jgi:hypothetical protein